MYRGLTKVLRMECPIAPGSTRVARKPDAEARATIAAERAKKLAAVAADCAEKRAATRAIQAQIDVFAAFDAGTPAATPSRADPEQKRAVQAHGQGPPTIRADSTDAHLTGAHFNTTHASLL